MSEQSYKKCPYCCEKITSLATKCKYCGQFLIEEKSKLKDAVCPLCHEAISSSDLKCEHCNSIITPELVSYSKGETQQNNSGMTTSTIIPENVKGWSWGAFVFSWLWGIPNRSFLTLFTLVPYVGLVWNFVCGAKGKEWAWQNKKWNSIEEFNNVQKVWDIAGSYTLVFFLVASIALIIYEASHPGTILKIISILNMQ